MSVLRYVVTPLVIIGLGLVYFLLSGEPAGSVLLVIFGGAMGVMGWTLLPTAANAGPTAPVDPDFEL
jgi:hypothetical protein